MGEGRVGKGLPEPLTIPLALAPLPVGEVWTTVQSSTSPIASGNVDVALNAPLSRSAGEGPVVRATMK